MVQRWQKRTLLIWGQGIAAAAASAMQRSSSVKTVTLLIKLPHFSNK
jgi:hypothetical protein